MEGVLLACHKATVWRMNISPTCSRIPQLSIELDAASLTGSLSHWKVLVHHGQQDLAAAKIARVYILADILVLFTQCVLKELPAQQAIKEDVTIGIAYIVALFGSITSSRLFLAPLRRIPGPRRLRLTKLTNVWDTARRERCSRPRDGDFLQIILLSSIICLFMPGLKVELG